MKEKRRVMVAYDSLDSRSQEYYAKCKHYLVKKLREEKERIVQKDTILEASNIIYIFFDFATRNTQTFLQKNRKVDKMFLFREDVSDIFNKIEQLTESIEVPDLINDDTYQEIFMEYRSQFPLIEVFEIDYCHYTINKLALYESDIIKSYKTYHYSMVDAEEELRKFLAEEKKKALWDIKNAESKIKKIDKFLKEPK